MSKLVIVESPSKAKSIQKYLGKDYTVVSSKGHIRDLPAAKLSVDVKNDFAPKYAVIKGKEKLVKELKELADNAEAVILAMSDLDIIAPIREMNLTRTEEKAYAESKGIELSYDKIYSIDENLWGRAIEGDVLEDPANEPPEDIYEWTKSWQDANDEPEKVSIEFEEGISLDLVKSHVDHMGPEILECFFTVDGKAIENGSSVTTADAVQFVINFV